MIRRWCIPLTTVALAVGSLMAVAGTASAATVSHPGTTHVRPGGAVHAFKPGGVMKRPSGALAHAAHGIKNASTTSTNWSGYAVTGANGHFTSVSASWTEPTAHCSGSSAKYAAFWVGLDGYNSSSVEQTGTDSDCDGSSPDYYGWYEMYPANPVYFNNAVSPGDHFTASVTFSGTGTYTLVLKDTTKGWTQTITKNQSGLARSSAEVITEAPSSSYRRPAAGQLRHHQLHRLLGQRLLDERPEPDLDHHDQQQRRGQGLDQLDQQLGRLQQHLDQEQLT